MTERDVAGDKAGIERSVRSDDSGEEMESLYAVFGEEEAAYGTIGGQSEMTEEEKRVLVVAHGDLDGIVSAALTMKAFDLSLSETAIRFTQPYLIDKVEVPETMERVFVVDIAVNNRDPEMTRKFVEKLRRSNTVFLWCDHHKGWEKIQGPEKTGFAIKVSAKSCAETFINSPGLTWGKDKTEIAEIEDWISDANASDTRQGELSERGQLIEQAMKANMSDDSIRESAVRWIVNGSRKDDDYWKLRKAQEKYQKVQEETEKLAKQYEIRNGVAVVDVREAVEDYDRTQLLLKGEQMAPTKTAVLLGKNLEGEEIVTVATMDKQKNLVNLFGLPSGAPFRVSLPAKDGWTVEKVLDCLERAGSDEPWN